MYTTSSDDVIKALTNIRVLTECRGESPKVSWNDNSGNANTVYGSSFMNFCRAMACATFSRLMTNSGDLQFTIQDARSRVASDDLERIISQNVKTIAKELLGDYVGDGAFAIIDTHGVYSAIASIDAMEMVPGTGAFTAGATVSYTNGGATVTTLDRLRSLELRTADSSNVGAIARKHKVACDNMVEIVCRILLSRDDKVSSEEFAKIMKIRHSADATNYNIPITFAVEYVRAALIRIAKLYTSTSANPQIIKNRAEQRAFEVTRQEIVHFATHIKTSLKSIQTYHEREHAIQLKNFLKSEGSYPVFRQVEHWLKTERETSLYMYFGITTTTDIESNLEQPELCQVLNYVGSLTPCAFKCKKDASKNGAFYKFLLEQGLVVRMVSVSNTDVFSLKDTHEFRCAVPNIANFVRDPEYLTHGFQHIVSVRNTAVADFKRLMESETHIMLPIANFTVLAVLVNEHGGRNTTEVQKRHFIKRVFKRTCIDAMKRLDDTMTKFYKETEHDGMALFAKNTSILSDTTPYSAISIKMPIRPHPFQAEYTQSMIDEAYATGLNLQRSTDENLNRNNARFTYGLQQLSANLRKPESEMMFEVANAIYGWRSDSRDTSYIGAISHYRVYSEAVRRLAELCTSKFRIAPKSILCNYACFQAARYYRVDNCGTIRGMGDDHATDLSMVAIYRILDLAMDEGGFLTFGNHYSRTLEKFQELREDHPEYTLSDNDNTQLSIIADMLQARLNEEIHDRSDIERVYIAGIPTEADDGDSGADDGDSDAAKKAAEAAKLAVTRKLVESMYMAICYILNLNNECVALEKKSEKLCVKYHCAQPGAGKTTSPIIAAKALKLLKAAFDQKIHGVHREVVFVCDFATVRMETYKRARDAGLNVTLMQRDSRGIKWLSSGKFGLDASNDNNPGFTCAARDMFIMDSQLMIKYVLKGKAAMGNGISAAEGNPHAFVFIDEFIGLVSDYAAVKRYLNIKSNDALTEFTNICKKYFPAILTVSNSPVSLTLSGASMIPCLTIVNKIRELQNFVDDNLSYEIMSQGRIHVSAQYKFAWDGHINMWNVCPQEQFDALFGSICQPLYRRTVGHHAALYLREVIADQITRKTKYGRMLAGMQDYLTYDLGSFTGETVAEYTIGLLYFILLYATRYVEDLPNLKMTCGEMQKYMRGHGKWTSPVNGMSSYPEGGFGKRREFLTGNGDACVVLPRDAPWPKTRFLFRDELGALYPQTQMPEFLEIFGILSTWTSKIPRNIMSTMIDRHARFIEIMPSNLNFNDVSVNDTPQLIANITNAQIVSAVEDSLASTTTISNANSIASAIEAEENASKKCCTVFDRIRHSLVSAHHKMHSAVRKNAKIEVAIVLDNNPLEIAVALVASIIGVNASDIAGMSVRAQNDITRALAHDRLSTTRKQATVAHVQRKQTRGGSSGDNDNDGGRDNRRSAVGTEISRNTHVADGPSMDDANAQLAENPYSGNAYYWANEIAGGTSENTASDILHAYFLSFGIMCFTNDDTDYITQKKFEYLKSQKPGCKIALIIGTTVCAYGINVENLTMAITSPRACLMTGTNTMSQFFFRAGRAGMSDDASLYVDALTIARMTESSTHSIGECPAVSIKANSVQPKDAIKTVTYTTPHSATFMKLYNVLISLVESADIMSTLQAIDIDVAKTVTNSNGAIAMVVRSEFEEKHRSLGWRAGAVVNNDSTADGQEAAANAQQFAVSQEIDRRMKELGDTLLQGKIFDLLSVYFQSFQISDHYHNMIRFIVGSICDHLHEPFGVSSVMIDENIIPFQVASPTWPRAPGMLMYTLRQHPREILALYENLSPVRNSMMKYSDAYLVLNALFVVMKRFVHTVDDVNFDEYSAVLGFNGGNTGLSNGVSIIDNISLETNTGSSSESAGVSRIANNNQAPQIAYVSNYPVVTRR